jgi:hypothetical protein
LVEMQPPAISGAFTLPVQLFESEKNTRT